MIYSLFLYPLEFNGSINKAEWVDYLKYIQVAEVANNHSYLLPGSRMMEFITYLGCSPAMSTGDNQARIYLHQYPELTGLGGESIDTLRYPQCKHAIPNPQHLLSKPLSDQWQCNQCSNNGLIRDINWRRSAAYSKIFVEITNIFPREAIPSTQLIELLKAFSHSKWNWFYSRSCMQ